MIDPDAVFWLDGELIPARDATVPAFDHALMVGDGAFETLRVVGGTPFAMTRHLRRLEMTLEALSIEVPGNELLRKAMIEIARHTPVEAGRLRLTVTGGDGPLGSGAPYGRARVIAAVETLGEPPIPAAVGVPWTRNERGALAGLKTTSYAENVRALRHATEHGASEAIFANTRAELCEGTGTNVFVVLGERVYTPPLSAGCLAGITRELVLERTTAQEKTLPYEVLAEADDILLTSSTRNVQILERMDDRQLGPPSPLAVEVAAAIDELIATDLDP